MRLNVVNDQSTIIYGVSGYGWSWLIPWMGVFYFLLDYFWFCFVSVIYLLAFFLVCFTFFDLLFFSLFI